MLTKQQVRDAVYALLYQDCEQRLLAKNPDRYYGWVEESVHPDTGEVVPAHWLGEQDVKDAEYAAAVAAERVRLTAQFTWANPDDAELLAQYDAARTAAAAAATRVDEVRSYRDRVVAEKRQQVVDRMVARQFVRVHRLASVVNWAEQLYNPAVPESLRRYVAKQLTRGPLAPVSLVFLYLTVQSTLEHADDFQVEAVTGYDYLADNPLAVSSLDINTPEDAPASRQRRAYVRELQASAIRDRMAPAHENHDPRDLLADFEYHGLPEQLKALWITKDEDASCPHCQQGVRVRTIHDGAGYRLARVCPNYAHDRQCLYDLLSPCLATRRQVRDWAQNLVAEHNATLQAA